MRKKTKKIVKTSNHREKVDPLKITLARVFFILNAVLWLAYGVYIYYDMAVLNNNKSSADVVTLFVFVNASSMFFCAGKIGKPQKWTYYFTLGIAVFNTLVSLLNIVDLYFLVSFIIDLLILWAIIPLHKQYFPKP